MSDWSSFENDKEITDAWRQFLTENEEELEEGWEDIYGGIIGYGKKKLGLGGDEEEGEAAASTLSKETPLSILKSTPGQTEKPLVAQLQHLGLSQSTAQQIAKRIGKYLRQRKLTIAEINTTELVNALNERLKQEDFDQARQSIADAEEKLAAAQQPHPDKRYRVMYAQADLKKANKRFRDLEAQLAMTKSAEQGARQQKAAAKAQKRSDIRAVGLAPRAASAKDTGIIGKIISRFVSDNQQLLQKDPGLQAIFDDPVKFNKLRSAVTVGIKRQLARRGYEEAEYIKLFEQMFYKELKKIINEGAK